MNIRSHWILDDDFPSACDLFVACMILKKQIDQIDAKREKIVIPSVAMNELHGNRPVGK